MMRKSPDERYPTPMQVAQALERYADDYPGLGYDRDEPPLLEPLEIEPAPTSSDVPHRYDAKPAVALVGAAGRETPRRAATNPDSRHYAADSATSLLTPDDDFDRTEEVRPILTPDPEPTTSGGQSRTEPRSPTDGSAPPDITARPPGWLAVFWLWGLIALAVIVTVIIVILATANPPESSARGPAVDSALSPTRK
jgi:hypothetical protein